MKKRTRVLFFGDSITEAAVYPGGYIRQLEGLLNSGTNKKTYDLIGSGISGNKIYDLYLRLEEDVLAKKPQIVVIYVGINDIWHKETHGTGTDADKFRKFYEAIIAKLKKRKIKVILCTPTTIGEQKDGMNPQDRDLDLYSNMIRDIAKAQDCGLCDLRKAFTAYNAAYNTDNSYNSVLTTDGVHLNALGNKLVAEMLEAEIR